MRTVSGMGCIVMGLAIIGPAFGVQAATEARDGFLRANPSDEVSHSYYIGLCVRGFDAKDGKISILQCKLSRILTLPRNKFV